MTPAERNARNAESKKRRDAALVLRAEKKAADKAALDAKIIELEGGA